MAGFSVVSEPVQTGWYPVYYNAETLYVGQIVTLDIAGPDYGLKAWNVAGAADTTANQIPFGVVIGFNNRTPVFDTTYKAEKGVSVLTQANMLARDWVGAEGMWSKGEPALMAQVAILDPTTILKGRIFNGAYGTAVAVGTNTTADSTGVTITTTALSYAGVAGNTLWYCRTGANAGLYRIGYDTSTTAHTVYLPWPYGIAVGDTFVGVNIGLGTCKMDLDAVGTYIEQYADANSFGTDYFWGTVLNANFKDAGNEYCIFRINTAQYFPVART